MPQKVFRKYGVLTTIDFTLFDSTGSNFVSGATHVIGDTKISIDGTAEGNTINGFTSVGSGYRIALDASEVTGKSIRLPIIDQPAKAWRDDALIIETYGHANAMHQFADLTTLIDGVTVEHIHELLMAMVNGRFLKDTPTGDDITFYKRDNTTVLTVVHINDSTGERTRLSP